MKTLVFFTVLVAAAALAGETVSVVGVEPPTEHNAHWQMIQDGIVGCVRDGLNVYGSNDSTQMMWAGQPINLGGYDGVSIRVSYSQQSADEGDYCKLFLGDGGLHLFHVFEDTGGELDSFTATLDEFYGATNLEMQFSWVSDETGVDEGFRMYNIRIDGVKWGEGYYTNIFTWDASNDVTGHQTFDVVEMQSGTLQCLAFEYGTDLDVQGWWAVDNVELLADGVGILPLQAGGYGVEDFGSGGWYQDKHGLSGEWELGTDHATGDMSGDNWQCDSAAHPGWRYEAETLSPWIEYAHSVTEVTVEFDTWLSLLGTGDCASFGFYAAYGHPVFDYTFHDLDDWELDDDGTEVTDTSWGAIKAGF
ncbi:MAG: hypothetical protein A2Y64_06430 [Candidatus Coatesbacteria bacterium RBG_13_66_14]|uniref:Uncharacterized protein n=1 Tax=Candidatus Coatesbacteria bacterium RBG_13_66_14 TaxID=1817816 RepID=A0A1F5FBE2_9BACT|nr:MAG: hypothetical protein A2Y64_06430 [Candidatus Coatesbacteria bacterium RBG_13_66_14]